jgi:4,5-DOPA dioxygenase extradiol
MSAAPFSNLAAAAPTEPMPVLFVGHGTPMNAVTDNPFRRAWVQIGRGLPNPRAILCVSAHWQTDGTCVAVTAKPATIHDFGGFPDELYRQNYPAPGAPDYARLTASLARTCTIFEDGEWGLDHGAWSILQSLFPQARTPVFQLSLDMTRPPSHHLKLARELASLRRRGVMLIASGNIVHNLRLIDPDASPFDWAIEFDRHIARCLVENDSHSLTDYQTLGRAATLSVPTLDHYLPLLYAQGFREEQDRLTFFTEAFDLGSLSMRSLILSR